MSKRRGPAALPLIILSVIIVPLLSCADARDRERELISDPFYEAQSELREVVQSIAHDVMTANVNGLQAVHLNSDKFTKFGPRSFDRQDVASTNESEVAFFTSVDDMSYEIEDLKIDVFGDFAVVTYYPNVTFTREGVETKVSGRQTLVFLETEAGWKIVHEHGTLRP